MAIKHRENINETLTIQRLMKFEHDKKTSFRMHEQQERGWREALDSLMNKTSTLKDDLLYIENQIVEDMETAIKDFDGKLFSIAKEMQDYVIGDHG